MRLLPALLAISLAASCSVSVVPASPPAAGSPKPGASKPPAAAASPATERLPADVTAESVAALWMPVPLDHPPGATVPDCPYLARGQFQLEQDGGKLHAVRSCGLCPIAAAEILDGTLAAGKVTLTGRRDHDGETHAYVLAFDAATQHLVGTRDGEPYRLAPVAKDAGERAEARRRANPDLPPCPSD